jgi:hypothetical protein
MPDLRISNTSAAHVQRIACSAGSDGQPSLDRPLSIAPCNAMAARRASFPSISALNATVLLSMLTVAVATFLSPV